MIKSVTSPVKKIISIMLILSYILANISLDSARAEKLNPKNTQIFLKGTGALPLKNLSLKATKTSNLTWYTKINTNSTLQQDKLEFKRLEKSYIASIIFVIVTSAIYAALILAKPKAKNF